MSVSDPIADMLTKVRNASVAGHEKVDIPVSKMKLEVVKILKGEGYIRSFKQIEVDEKQVIRVYLKYDDAANAVIHGLKRVSTPGRRVYAGYENLPRVYNGMGTVIVSTSLGVVTGKKATEEKVGGELICTVW
jgi:small subunit ribosomal protein S8